MPADHASGRFALLLNGQSRKTFLIGTTAALNLLISTAAHADRCVFPFEDDAGPLAALGASVAAPHSCMASAHRLDGEAALSAFVAGAQGLCFVPAHFDRGGPPGAATLPAQQPAAR